MDLLFTFLPLSGGNIFFWDPWSSLFACLILGIGALIAIFAWQYFDSNNARWKFYGAFFPFMAAMLGLVLSNHFLILFLCWELTSLLSFFLISYKGYAADARRGALHAALVTGAGGLCLLTAILLLGAGSGAWTIEEALKLNLNEIPHGEWIGALIVLGAVTKSAQFPFHFWLPGAMTAPTPASAYLHSATMVKAGVYLLYRLEPMLGTLPWFSPCLMIFGFATFFLGSVSSIFQMDLKAVLAGTTLANLGLMVALIGAPFPQAHEAVIALVLAHALYKAGLFLFAGIVERLAQTRDLSRISGLGKAFPHIQALGLVLAGSNLGIPFTLGYYAKNLLSLPLGWKIALLVGFTLLGKAGLLVAVRPFWGKTAGAPGAHTKRHSPEMLMLIGPITLGILSWSLPLFVGVWGPALNLPVTDTIPKLNFSLFLTLLSCSIAFFLAWSWKPEWAEWWRKNSFPPGAKLFDEIWYGHLRFMERMINLVQNGNLRFYVATIFFLFAAGLFWLTVPPAEYEPFSGGISYVLLFLASAKVLGTSFLVISRKPIVAIIFLGLVGYSLALSFALLGAPDLAITQFSIETLSVFLLALVLRGVPDCLPEKKRMQVPALLFSGSCGLAIGLAVYTAALQQAPSRLRNFFGEASWLEAHGRNVVNVILVDFRGLDTLGEISVLALAGYGVFLLLRGKLSP